MFPEICFNNSYEVRKLVKGDHIVIATSAYYMIRAKALFTRRGFIVIPAPFYFLAQARVVSFNSLIPKKVTSIVHTKRLRNRLAWHHGICGEKCDLTAENRIWNTSRTLQLTMSVCRAIINALSVFQYGKRSHYCCD